MAIYDGIIGRIVSRSILQGVSWNIGARILLPTGVSRV